ncbi:hypothetical protein D3C79_1032150 [compost metagenome]
MVVGDRVELLELHAFHLFNAIFQFLQRQHARLALAHRLGQKLCRLHCSRQALNGERLDVHLAIATGYLLQTHSDHHALMA